MEEAERCTVGRLYDLMRAWVFVGKGEISEQVFSGGQKTLMYPKSLVYADMQPR